MKPFTLAHNISGADLGYVQNQDFKELDLKNNLIPYVETLVFVNEDGTSRFPNLEYLNLANNRMIFFDLLFPLTMPSPKLKIEATSNPINKLNNTVNLNYALSFFSYAVVGNRSVDLRGNQLTVFDDSNLLQYGLQSANDLQVFLYRISNYDLRQMNSQSIIVCSCSGGSKLTSIWYADLLSKNLVDNSTLISKLYCSNQGQEKTFVLDFSCDVSVSKILIQ